MLLYKVVFKASDRGLWCGLDGGGGAFPHLLDAEDVAGCCGLLARPSANGAGWDPHGACDGGTGCAVLLQ
uniref:Uncharacterized protein n=1 Tax=Escherichia coli TaxID=562 RepID=A0A0C5BDA7_ECOLX|nr:hypothetical protein EL78_p6509 [Escherichia coli]BDZ85560.1 hypothetical protein VEE68_00070 [Escherichia coli]